MLHFRKEEEEEKKTTYNLLRKQSATGYLPGTSGGGGGGDNSMKFCCFAYLIMIVLKMFVFVGIRMSDVHVWPIDTDWKMTSMGLGVLL